MSKEIIINGSRTEVPDGAIAWKYADPVEDARWLFDEEDVIEISEEDDSIIRWADDTVHCRCCGDEIFSEDAIYLDGEPHCRPCIDIGC